MNSIPQKVIPRYHFDGTIHWFPGLENLLTMTTWLSKRSHGKGYERYAQANGSCWHGTWNQRCKGKVSPAAAGDRVMMMILCRSPFLLEIPTWKRYEQTKTKLSCLINQTWLIPLQKRYVFFQPYEYYSLGAASSWLLCVQKCSMYVHFRNQPQKRCKFNWICSPRKEGLAIKQYSDRWYAECGKKYHYQFDQIIKRPK